MSTHEGLPVSGYKPQSEEALAVVNGNKWFEELLLRRLDALAVDPTIDKRWLAIGRTAIEQGFMAINRAVFKPERAETDNDNETIIAKLAALSGGSA